MGILRSVVFVGWLVRSFVNMFVCWFLGWLVGRTGDGRVCGAALAWLRLRPTSAFSSLSITSAAKNCSSTSDHCFNSVQVALLH